MRESSNMGRDLHGIGAEDLEINLSDKKKEEWTSRWDKVDFSDQKKKNERAGEIKRK
jgi:hypothetical protein